MAFIAALTYIAIYLVVATIFASILGRSFKNAWNDMPDIIAKDEDHIVGDAALLDRRP